MLTTNQHNYIGKGSLLIEILGRIYPLGNVTALKISVDEEKKELKDYENAGGGTINTVSRIKSAGFDFTVTDISPRNLALALRGTTDTQAAASITGEAFADIAFDAALLLSRIPDPAQPIVVKLGTTVLVEGLDYQRIRSTITPLSGGSLHAGDDITVDYHALPENLTDAMTTGAQEYKLIFDGLNEAQSGRPVRVEIPRAKFNPAKALDLIGDDFSDIKIEGDILKDPSLAGTGRSQYFTVRMAA